jgi:hypothetical protein
MASRYLAADCRCDANKRVQKKTGHDPITLPRVDRDDTYSAFVVAKQLN